MANIEKLVDLLKTLNKEVKQDNDRADEKWWLEELANWDETPEPKDKWRWYE